MAEWDNPVINALTRSHAHSHRHSHPDRRWCAGLHRILRPEPPGPHLRRSPQPRAGHHRRAQPPAASGAATASRSCSPTDPRWQAPSSPSPPPEQPPLPSTPRIASPSSSFYLSDLGAKALVLADGDDSPARAAAAALGIRILEIAHHPASPAGTFHFTSEPASTPTTRPGPATPDDIALLLHTSGTTSRPKLVPLLHRNVCATAENIRRTLRLEPADRCLNVMPLFHIHGLNGVRSIDTSRRRQRLLRAGVQRAKDLLLARRRRPNLVFRRPDHAPGDPGPRRPQPRHHRPAAAPVRPLLLGRAPDPRDGRAGRPSSAHPSRRPTP